MKKKRTKDVIMSVVLVLSIVLLCFTGIGCGEEEHKVNIRYLQTIPYREEVGNVSENFLADTFYAFRTKWNMLFTHSVANINDNYISACPTASLNSICTCSKNCTNSTSTFYHHTNSGKMLNAFSNSISDSNYDIFVILTAAKLCLINDSTNIHSNDIAGLAFLKGDWAICNLSPKSSEIINGRVIQHELSHLYGCNEGVCSGEKLCIMSGGYDETALLSTNDIWCSNCENSFKVSLH